MEGGRAAWVPRSPAPIPATPRRGEEEEEEWEQHLPFRHASPQPTPHATCTLENQVPYGADSQNFRVTHLNPKMFSPVPVDSKFLVEDLELMRYLYGCFGSKELKFFN